MSRIRRAGRWLKRHPYLAFTGLLLGGFAVLNGLAYSHARAMTTFVEADGSRRSLEDMSRWQRVRALVCGVTVTRPENTRTPADLGLPFTTRTTTSSDGLDLEVWLIPHARPQGVVVLAHGYAASKDSLLDPARGFHDLGYSTVLLDFRGSGGSAGSSTSLGWHEARDVAATVDLARRLANGKPVVLFGTSMGAAAALRAIHSEGVRPDALIVEAPFNRLLDTVRNRFDLMGVPAFPTFPAAELLCFWGSTQADIEGFSHDPVDYAGSVECPTLVLHGDEDQRVSVTEVNEVYDALAAEGKRLHVFVGLGHESYVAARPEKWKEIVVGFMPRRHQTRGR